MDLIRSMVFIDSPYVGRTIRPVPLSTSALICENDSPPMISPLRSVAVLVAPSMKRATNGGTSRRARRRIKLLPLHRRDYNRISNVDLNTIMISTDRGYTVFYHHRKFFVSASNGNGICPDQTHHFPKFACLLFRNEAHSSQRKLVP